MTTVAERNGPGTLSNRVHHYHSHNHHNQLNHHQPPISGTGIAATVTASSQQPAVMLYTSTPVAAQTPTMATSVSATAVAAAAAAAAAASPTTAFPFPPPTSPLFMSTFNSLLASQNSAAAAAAAAAAALATQQPSSHSSQHTPVPHLSPWLNPSLASFLAANKQLLEQQKTPDNISTSNSLTADDNNNELQQHPPTPPKHRSRVVDVMDCESIPATLPERNSPQHLEMRNSLTLSTSASSASSNTPSVSTSGGSHKEGSFKPLLLNPFVNSGVASPTFGLSATRPPPPSPSQNTTYPYPLLYPPYFQQSQNGSSIQNGTTSFSPNGQPPFLLPGSTSVSPSPNLTLNSKDDCSDTPTDLSKSLKCEQSFSSSNGLKRKSPVIEDSHNVPSPSNLPPSSMSSSLSSFRAPEVSDSKILSGSRKHRILKPPNINIQEFPNGSSSFLNSPIFTPQFGGVPSSPFTFGIDHIPLSAPPIPSQQTTVSSSSSSSSLSSSTSTSTSGRCFDFSANDTQQNGQHGQQFISSKDLTNRNSSSQILSTNSARSVNFPSSIMKENKHNGNKKNGSSDSRVTFQVPAAPINSHSSNSHNSNNSIEQSNNSKSKNRYWGSQYPNYQRGTEVLLGNGSLKPIEQLSMQDFAVEDENVRMQLAEIANVIEKKKGIIRIGFIIGQNRFKYSVDMPIEHPFFVYQKGWSSYSPDVTRKRYGLKCGLLTKGDIVVTVTNKVNMKPSKHRNGSTGSLSSGSLSSSTSSLSSTSGSCSNAFPSNLATAPKRTISNSKASSSSITVGNSRDDDDDVEIDVENE